MTLKILLVNPWIYDFAAFNLWSRPLGLLHVAEYLSSFDTKLSLIDCTDSFETNKYGAGRFRAEIVEKPSILKCIPRFYKRYGICLNDFANKLKGFTPVDIVLMTCIMSYWYPGIQKTVEIIRDILGNVPVILGGIYSTLFHEHSSKNSGADFIYKGTLDNSLYSTLNTFGFKLQKKREPIPYYKLNLYENYPFAPILTSQGCPFHCSYCASGSLHNNYQKRPIDSVLEEIRELYNLGIRDYSFYDDALLFDSEIHLKPLLRGIIKARLNVRFHTPNGLHARFIDEESALLMKAAHLQTIRLSLETVNDERQKKIGDKVTNEDLENAVMSLKKQGYTKKEIGVYLMYGLPGQELEEIKSGIRFLKSLDVSIHLTEFSPIKGTKCWDALVQSGCIDDNLDPLLTNNTVFSYIYSAYDPKDVEKMKLDVKEYNHSL
ncbi:MAG: radical SAM protein [Nitrospirota bacterium]|nr:radical SAM protein [Nitrospirota bacterium]MDH5768652.1 radical SAM protein [Nitrospirota bacterium]